MRRLALLFILLIFVLPAFAQEEEQTGYEIALRELERTIPGDIDLDLSGLGLTELPPELWEKVDLHYLYLADNQLSSLPPEIARLSHLQVLNLRHNQLVSLPAEIGSLSLLTSLHLTNNQLRALPPEIGNLSSLDLLFLENNQLSSLPPEIGNLKNLSHLSLDSNQLSYLPPEIGNLSNLCWIGFRDNPIQHLPIEFADLEGLLREGCGFGADESLIPTEVADAPVAIRFEYLRNEAWWHLQRLIAGGASSIGLLATIVLGFRWKNRRGKKKRDD